MNCRWENVPALEWASYVLNFFDYFSVTLSSLPSLFPFSSLIVPRAGQGSLSSRCGYAEYACRLHRLGVSGAHYLRKLSSTGNVVFAAEWTGAAAGGSWVSAHRYQPQGESRSPDSCKDIILSVPFFFFVSVCQIVATVWYLKNILPDFKEVVQIQSNSATHLFWLLDWEVW